MLNAWRRVGGVYVVVCAPVLGGTSAAI